MWQQEDRGRMSLPFISPRLCDLEVSFEFFPPKTAKTEEVLWESIDVLAPLKPKFVSVTYGAAGTTRVRTHEIVTHIHQRTGLSAAAHLTCIGATRGEIDDIARSYWDSGIRHIVALRGDPPKGAADFQTTAGGLSYANDLVALLRGRHGDLCLGVAGYPEKHPEAPSAAADLASLKRKVEAGAAFVTTQLFFDNDLYFRFVERCRAAGITVPIVPGIMPVLSLKQILRFTTMCGASLPAELVGRLEAAGDQPEAVEAVGIDWAHRQIRGLLDRGSPGYHLYILNRAKSALALAAKL